MPRSPPCGVDSGTGLNAGVHGHGWCRLSVCACLPTIYRRCGGAIDALIGEVALDRCGIALGGRPIAASTRGDDFDRLSGTQAAGAIDERLDPVAEPEGAASAGLTALKTPGRRQQPRAVEPQVAF